MPPESFARSADDVDPGDVTVTAVTFEVVVVVGIEALLAVTLVCVLPRFVESSNKPPPVEDAPSRCFAMNDELLALLFAFALVVLTADD